MEKKKFTREFEPAVKKFLCPECGEQHDTRRGAINCCPPEDIEVEFSCGSCGSVFGTRSEAEACCAYYTCDDCGEDFSTLADAKNHVCSEDEE